MADASPPKWHLAHVAWFFETFVLRHADSERKPFNETYNYLFNSYYEGVGKRHPRPQRGHLSRPLVSEIYDYREHIYGACNNLLMNVHDQDLTSRVILGTHHEQQHQELLITDLKYNLGKNPLRPAYREISMPAAKSPGAVKFKGFDGGKIEIGTTGEETAFCFDNEVPKHAVWLEPFAIADRLITNQEYMDFMEDGGYETPELWLSDGWAEREKRSWHAPEYWYQDPGGAWLEYTLHGTTEVDPNLPVCHISYYEADAFARWSKLRLPTEQEWEHAARSLAPEISDCFAEEDRFHPQSEAESRLMCGNLWQWTASGYAPYPGYQPLAGTLGEYNGKFMSNQYVLRGGSCATPRHHYRHSYRNFFYPKDRWQFTGIRLAESLET